MTDQEQDTKKTKLTLNSTKLSLGNKSLLSQPRKSSGVVVEVNKGRVNSGLKLSLNRNAVPLVKIDQESSDRRLEALKRVQDSKHEKKEEISTLSKLAEINKLQEIEEVKIEEIIAEEQEGEEIVQLISQNAIGKTDKKEHVEPIDNLELVNIKKDIIKTKPVVKAAAQKDTKEEEEEVVAAKVKISEPKKLKKSDILSMLNSDSGDDLPQRTRSLASIKRAKEKERRKNASDSFKQEKVYREVILPEVITVGELSNKMSERAADVIRELMKLGVMATTNQSIDADTAELIANSFGHSVKRFKESDIENILIYEESNEVNLKNRAPIVTVMGHVDHGKTSLLDALKSTDVVAGEAGGITQHIGAYSVTMSDGRMITFLDTPGHEAFTEMRTRGAQVTDIVVLVVAADDGIKSQTIEAINHAKAASVPIIVAINKIDRPGADIERVKNELLIHELVPEDFGGDVMTVAVSAKQKINLDKLEEAILLLAEMQELKADSTGYASGVVIESRVDAQRGVIATVIVQRGNLKKGDIIIAGKTSGRIKRLCNHLGRSIHDAGPSIAVEIFGLNEAPMAGDLFNIVQTDKQARDIVDYRIKKEKNLKVTASKTSLEDLFLKASGNQKTKQLPIIIKGDVHGSVEAIISSLNKIESDEVKIKILHSAVGGIAESDTSLAQASNAIIIGFNVRANAAAAADAENNKVDIRYYSIIYDLINDIRAIMSGMLSPIIRESYIGSVDIREVFNITKVGKIAGSYVTKGIIKRGAGVRLLRDDIVIHEGKLKTLKRFKDDVKEVREGYECGIAFENYTDIKIGDKVEVFEIVEEKQKL